MGEVRDRGPGVRGRRVFRLIVALLWIQVSFALDKPVVEMAAQPAQVSVGDRVTVTITYRWPHGWRAAEPDPTAVFAEAFVVECPPPETVRTAEEERRTWKLVILATRSGAWPLPRPQLRVQSATAPIEALAPEVVVQVGAEAAPPQPATARPLWTAGAGEAEPKRWLAVIAAAALAIAALAGWWWLGRRRSINSEPPGERLRRELRELAELRDGKEVSARLGVALRRWCGTVFVYDGLGLTTRETLARLRGELLDDEQAALGKLLGDLDDLRWAAGSLNADVVLPLCSRALAWSDAIQGRLTAERAAAEKKAA